jgi:hypothetical protein
MAPPTAPAPAPIIAPFALLLIPFFSGTTAGVVLDVLFVSTVAVGAVVVLAGVCVVALVVAFVFVVFVLDTSLRPSVFAGNGAATGTVAVLAVSVFRVFLYCEESGTISFVVSIPDFESLLHAPRNAAVAHTRNIFFIFIYFIFYFYCKFNLSDKFTKGTFREYKYCAKSLHESTELFI